MNDQDNERELVLGNRQLLTIFFVATLLCGVFFAMGYVVGGNSAKASLTAPNADASTAPVTEGQREQLQSSAATEVAPPATSDPGNRVPGPEPRVGDNPIASG